MEDKRQTCTKPLSTGVECLRVRHHSIDYYVQYLSGPPFSRLICFVFLHHTNTFRLYTITSESIMPTFCTLCVIDFILNLNIRLKSPFYHQSALNYSTTKKTASEIFINLLVNTRHFSYLSEQQ